VAEIIADRVRAASRDPSREAILLIGHGAGDDIEDARWLDRMQEATTALDGTYRAIEVATLREDWPEKRTVAEAEIRAFVSGRSDAGLRVIVVPFRLYGEGPYRDVLGELDFTMTPALAPHGAVEEWILATAKRISCAEGWDSPLGS
jgi:sirohydrochlorin cobaltochelatase